MKKKPERFNIDPNKPFDKEEFLAIAGEISRNSTRIKLKDLRKQKEDLGKKKPPSEKK